VQNVPVITIVAKSVNFVTIDIQQLTENSGFELIRSEELIVNSYYNQLISEKH